MSDVRDTDVPSKLIRGMHFGLFSPHKTTANATRKMVPKQAPTHDFTGHPPPTQSPVCLGGALFKTMSIDELITKLNELHGDCMLDGGDPEINHGIADRLLLEFIGNDDVTKAFEAIEKWYA